MTGLVILLIVVGSVVILLIMAVFWSICMAAERADRWEEDKWNLIKADHASQRNAKARRS